MNLILIIQWSLLLLIVILAIANGIPLTSVNIPVFNGIPFENSINITINGEPRVILFRVRRGDGLIVDIPDDLRQIITVTNATSLSPSTPPTITRRQPPFQGPPPPPQGPPPPPGVPDDLKQYNIKLNVTLTIKNKDKKKIRSIIKLLKNLISNDKLN